MTSWFNLFSLTEQGSKLVEVYTNDLTEFATTIKSEASQLIQPVVNVVESKGTIENDRSHNKKRGQILKQQTSSEQRLMQLQKNVNTYTLEIPKLSKNDKDNTNNLEEEDIFTKQFYEKWNLESKTSEISKLLEENEIVRNKHEELVPVQVKYEDFWTRYYYRFEQFLQEEEKRKKLQTLAKEGEELEEWDDEEEEDDDIYEELEEDHSNIQSQYLKLKEILLTFLTTHEDDRARELHELLLRECPFVFETPDETKDEVESVEQLIEPINAEKEVNKEEIEITESKEQEKEEQLELDQQKETEDFENWE